LMQTLHDGWTEGQSRALGVMQPIPDGAAFMRLGTGPRPGRIIAGRIWQLGHLRKQAMAIGDTHIPTVIALSPTFRPHRMEFDTRGFWVQRGGLFGASDRSGPRIGLTTFSRRIAAETRRIAKFRAVTD
jgi:O-antigen biosynthesis protein